MNKKEDLVFINHILDSINAIHTFLKGVPQEVFISDRLRQSAVIREIEIIGEAVKNISSQLQRKYPEVGWQNIAQTRDKMIHHYFGVDLGIVWGIVTRDLPILRKKMEKIKSALE